MRYSQNGWPAGDIGRTSTRPVPGSAVKLRVVKGAAGDLLLWVAHLFDTMVEDIDDPGVPNDWGYADRPVRGGSDTSNHASGTAIDLNANRHVLGTPASASFSAAQIKAIRAIVHACGGLVRWGGDYTGRKDPMHFEITGGTTEAECAAVLRLLTKEDDSMPLSAADKAWISKEIHDQVWQFKRKDEDTDASGLLKEIHTSTRYLDTKTSDARNVVLDAVNTLGKTVLAKLQDGLSGGSK